MVDNKTVQFASNYLGIEAMGKVIQAYNRNIGGMDLVYMLIALYRIKG